MSDHDSISMTQAEVRALTSWILGRITVTLILLAGMFATAAVLLDARDHGGPDRTMCAVFALASTLSAVMVGLTRGDARLGAHDQ